MFSSFFNSSELQTTQGLQFDRQRIENLILLISDRFDFRVEVNETNKSLLWILGGILAGGYLGHRLYGYTGAAAGGTAGGVCGYGMSSVPLRNIWEDVKSKLSCLFRAVYNFIANLRTEDYEVVLEQLIRNGSIKDLAKMILKMVAEKLGARVLSSLSAA